jgi:6-pyruvoyl-tetrahydropterin synthase
MTLTGVGCFFSATHHVPEGGDPHGHSYEVIAWFPEGEDARRLQAQLIAVTEAFDHKVLPDRLASGEALAAYIGHALVNCVEVEIRRPLERIYARWIAQ